MVKMETECLFRSNHIGMVHAIMVCKMGGSTEMYSKVVSVEDVKKENDANILKRIVDPVR